jgi:hypothetical protein
MRFLNAVSLLSRHYHRSPDRLTQDDLQNWILYLAKDRQLEPPCFSVAKQAPGSLCGRQVKYDID